MKNLFSKQNMKRAGFILALALLLFAVVVRTGALLDPLANNYMMTDIQERTGVNLEWLLLEEPSVQVGACPLKDGDMLYYDDVNKDWTTSNECHPASVDKNGESFVNVSSSSIYRFDIMEAEGFAPGLSSVTLMPFCAVVIGFGEDAANGVELHYGCETQIGAIEFAAFEVHFISTVDAFTE